MKPHEFEILKQQFKERILPAVPMILVGMGTCGIGNGADVIFNRLEACISETKSPYLLKQTGCFGFCAQEPLVTLYQPGKPLLVYCRVNEKDAIHLVDALTKGRIYNKKIT